MGFKWAANLSYEGGQTALKPFAPVHLKATVQENGDLALNWIRRTRWEGDSWATSDIPVQEDKLAFSLKISHKPAGETDQVLLKTYETSTEQLVIPKADLLQMLGAGTHVLTCEVAQKSTKFGLGTTADCLASVTL